MRAQRHGGCTGGGCAAATAAAAAAAAAAAFDLLDPVLRFLYFAPHVLQLPALAQRLHLQHELQRGLRYEIRVIS